MIKNIIFDIGNVLIDYLPRTYLEGRYEDPALREQLFDAVFASKEWDWLDQGTITVPEAISAWSSRHPSLKPYIHEIMADWYYHMPQKQDTIAMLRQLKEAGQQAYYLSNFPEEAYLQLWPTWDFWPLFDGGILSYLVKRVKPDPEIYQLLLNRYQLTPEECVFFDDMPVNVAAAREQGIHAFVFTDAAAAQKDLAGLGISLD